MNWQDIIPVAVSIVVIILIAVLEKHSKWAAAVTATMPLTAPMALWIVYASSNGEREPVAKFGRGMLLATFPSLAFLIVTWLTSRAGWKLVPMILLGYGAWAIVLLVLTALERRLGL